jgi:hypothetical protein
MDNEKHACDQLLGNNLRLNCWHTIPWVLNNIDCFVRQSEGNKRVEKLTFYPCVVDGQGDEVWDKLGQAIGNLQGLKMLTIGNGYLDSPILDWEILARILSHVRQRIALNIPTFSPWRVGDARSFARAIHGHPAICSFTGGTKFPHESVDALYSALATLPALESISLSNRNESTMAHHESLIELLRVPSLRSVCFKGFTFTPDVCRATANALMEGTVITNLKFTLCKFSTEECDAILANGLARNTSVSHIKVKHQRGQALYSVLATALSSNSTLLHLELDLQNNGDRPDLSPLFLALGKNTGVKNLRVKGFCSMDESLCIEIQNGLRMNETLESLELNGFSLCDADLWHRAFSFLRTSTALKSLKIHLGCASTTESCLSAFRINIAAMLQENTSLESLNIRILDCIKIEAEECFVLVTALQHNTTLKFLNLKGRGRLTLTHDEDKQMASLLKNNYALERFPYIDLENEAGDVGAILRLNVAGRRYLTENGSSISKGVEVLSRVNNDINCVFLHLLENPRLCDRRAVEMVTADESNSRPTNLNTSSAGGKREQASAHEGKESRRRL